MHTARCAAAAHATCPRPPTCCCFQARARSGRLWQPLSRSMNWPPTCSRQQTRPRAATSRHCECGAERARYVAFPTFLFLRLRVQYQARGDHGCRCVSGSDADLLPTAACQLSLFTTAYIAMRVFLHCNNIALSSVAACTGLSLGLPPSPACTCSCASCENSSNGRVLI